MRHAHLLAPNVLLAQLEMIKQRHLAVNPVLPLTLYAVTSKVAPNVQMDANLTNVLMLKALEQQFAKNVLTHMELSHPNLDVLNVMLTAKSAALWLMKVPQSALNVWPDMRKPT